MKAKLILFTLALTVASAGFLVWRPKAAIKPVVGDISFSGAPVLPEDAVTIQKRIRESSLVMEKQLLPLLQKMPGEVKRVQEMLARNEQLLKQMAEFERTLDPGTKP